ncbi:hypothetical protein ACFWV1_26245 [Streptomyces sp. NPDC058700]|uniref:hypothetical protein n=1 Tax=Streptomyces sp. NPDC058700 TaxID=3346607 RepID=UPI003664D0A3
MTQQPARTDLYDALDQSWYRWGPPGTPKADSLNRLLDAHATEARAAALREAADAQTQLAVADDLARRKDMAAARRQFVKELRRMAEEARS